MLFFPVDAAFSFKKISGEKISLCSTIPLTVSEVNGVDDYSFCILYLRRDLSYGKGSTAPLKNAKLPTVKSVEPWDGKDGVVRLQIYYAPTQKPFSLFLHAL